MSLFIKQIADTLAGQVAFSLPDGKGGWVESVGFLSENPTIKLGNKWDPLLSDLSTINEFTQLAGWGQSSWVATSKMAWKGTDPLTVGLDFYLITYLKSQVDGTGTGKEAPISKQATCFARLVAIDEVPEDRTVGALKGLRVGVHGGYSPNYFQDNEGLLLDNSNISNLLGNDDTKNNVNLMTANEVDSTCQIVINGNGMNTVVLKNMLLESLEMTPSTVRAGYWQGITNKGIQQTATFKGSAEPLYIRMNANFKLSRAATVGDIAGLFGGKPNV